MKRNAVKVRSLAKSQALQDVASMLRAALAVFESEEARESAGDHAARLQILAIERLEAMAGAA